VPNIFDGVIVLDLTNNLAGPHAAAMLADFGADVIKVEKPGGEDNRAWAPFIDGVSLYGLTFNRGKKSIVVDLSKPEGKEILIGLLAKADVIIESFRPGAIKRMGFAYDDIIKIKQDIIMCSISGLGQTGPNSQKPGYDVIAQAASGIMSMTGSPDGPPTKIGTAVADWTGGFNAFGAIAAALYYRAKTGEGQYIDVALSDGLLFANEYAEIAFNGLGTPSRVGNHHYNLCPYGVFRGVDGEVIIATVSDKLWTQLCTLMGKEDLLTNPLYSTSGARTKNQKTLIPIIEDWVKSFSSVEEVRDLLEANGIPSAKVNTSADVVNDPQFIARDMILDLKVAAISAGKVKTRGIPMKFSKTPGKVTFASVPGENAKEILKDYLSYDDQKIAEIKDKGILGR